MDENLLLKTLDTVHWPSAFYLFSALSVIILEPIAASSSPWIPAHLQKSVKIFLGFGKTLPVESKRNSWWIRFMTVPKRFGICSFCLCHDKDIFFGTMKYGTTILYNNTLLIPLLFLTFRWQ